MPQYTISPTAIRDLEDIIDYFTERNVETGDRLLNEFTKKCRYLTQIPINWSKLFPDSPLSAWYSHAKLHHLLSHH